VAGNQVDGLLLECFLLEDVARERFREIFEGGGAEVTVHWSNVGHGLVPEDLDAAAAWFSRARAGGGS